MNQILDFITRFLVKYVDAWKLKSPGAFILIGAILYAIFAVLDYFVGTGAIKEPVIEIFGLSIGVIGAIKYIVVALGFSLGAHTSEILDEEKEVIQDWQTNTQYAVGTKVTQQGKVYQATQFHTSSGINQPIVDQADKTGIWTLIK